MTDFDYYTQFKFTQKEIDALEYYISTSPSDLTDAQDTLTKVKEFNQLMNDLNDNKIADQYNDLNLTIKIKAYEDKLLEKTNAYYSKTKKIKDNAFTKASGLPDTEPWKRIIENTY